jgi:hypothetical protein
MGCQQANYIWGTSIGLVLLVVCLFNDFCGQLISGADDIGPESAFDECIDRGLVPGIALFFAAEFVAWILLRKVTKTTLVLTNRRIVKMTSVVKKCCPGILVPANTSTQRSYFLDNLCYTEVHFLRGDARFKIL